MSTNTRPVAVTYLVVGLVFLGISLSWALRQSGMIDADQLGWLLPLMLIVAGLVGLAAYATRGFRGSRGDRRPGATPATDEPAPGPDPELTSLETAAYAPYPRDLERSRLLDDSTADLGGVPPSRNKPRRAGHPTADSPGGSAEADRPTEGDTR